MPPISLSSLALEGLADVAVGCGVLLAYRWTRRRSPRLAGIFAAGVLLRAVGGVLLFTISLLHWPVLTSLQTGGGFWTLAIDAHWYFNEAAMAVSHGIGTIPGDAPSPAYLRALAAWMTLTGVSPASGVLFNVTCFVAGALIVIAVAGVRTAAAEVALVALSISPALVIFSTQDVKESFCVLAMTIVLGGLWLWCRMFREAQALRPLGVLVAVASMTAGIYVTAGIRAYIGAFIIAAMTPVAAMLVVQSRSARWRALLAQVVILLVLWAGFRAGAGAYYPYYEHIAREAVSWTLSPTSQLDEARAAFVATGGATSIASTKASSPTVSHGLARSGASSEPARSGAPPEPAPLALFKRLVIGSAAIFVPISIARALSLVRFNGGRGLLFVTDIDTIFMDVLILSALYLTFAANPRFWTRPVIVFVLLLVVMTALPMAYVVTNFGTLFRLRLLVAVPLWLLPAFAGAGEKEGLASRQARQERSIEPVAQSIEFRPGDLANK